MSHLRIPILALLAVLLLPACRTAAPAPDDAAVAATAVEAAPLDRIAEDYVRLILAVGRHDAGYVDAYYGPEAWAEEIEAGEPTPLANLAQRAAALRAEAEAVTVEGDALLELRRRYLARQLEAVEARLAMLMGTTFSFDEEARALYGVTPPHHDLEQEFGPVLEALDEALPGEGDRVTRYGAFRDRFVLPPDRIRPVLEAAIEECRRRTRDHVALPADERFELELVEDKPWGGYNWYQGGHHSLIQVNVSVPTTVDRAIDLACHEGYPGHHTYNALLEQHLVRGRGWVEMSVYPLYSPQSLIAEGTANFGIDAAFPGDARTRFERDVLFPLAGLDPAEADAWARVRELKSKLDYAGNEIARRYLDGEVDADEAADLLGRWLVMTPDQARQRLRFIDGYRSYVINYNLGQDLVRRWIEAEGGTVDRPERRWEIFLDLLASPRLPDGLAVDEPAGAASEPAHAAP